MLDAICHGRLEVGFARAFLPHEFARFGVSVDESRARFAEGMEQVRLLLEQENVSSDGNFHKFGDTTSLPRPTQKPRPALLGGGARDPRKLHRHRQGRPFDHGDPDGRRDDEGADRALPPRLARGRPSGQWPRDAGLPSLLPREPRHRVANRARALEPLSALAGRCSVGLGRDEVEGLSGLRQDHRSSQSRRPSTRRSRAAQPGSARPTTSRSRSRSITRASAASRAPRCSSISTPFAMTRPSARRGSSARRSCRAISPLECWTDLSKDSAILNAQIPATIPDYTGTSRCPTLPP